ncbi:Uncharacterized protein APZ42_000502, partial [Daphnia magna]
LSATSVRLFSELEEVSEWHDIGLLWGNYCNMATTAFKPYGKPPPFDLDEYKDSFELWHKKWKIFLSLSTIDSELDAGDRGLYKAHTLLSCLSTDTLQAVLSMGLTDAQLG